MKTMICSFCKNAVIPAFTEINPNRYECACHTWRLIYDKPKR